MKTADEWLQEFDANVRVGMPRVRLIEARDREVRAAALRQAAANAAEYCEGAAIRIDRMAELAERGE